MLINLKFFWLDSRAEAATDAALKGYAAGEWEYFDEPVRFDLEKYKAVYFQAGNIKMERLFAEINNNFSYREPSWCN